MEFVVLLKGLDGVWARLVKRYKRIGYAQRIAEQYVNTGLYKEARVIREDRLVYEILV